MSANLEHSPFRKLTHQVDLCVVGGGMAGVCAAVAAARHGAKVVLMQDRPVLGGNASGEIGVHILGADRNGFIPYARETGILEEVLLDNLRRNRQQFEEFYTTHVAPADEGETKGATDAGSGS